MITVVLVSVVAALMVLCATACAVLSARLQPPRPVTSVATRGCGHVGDAGSCSSCR